MDGITIETICLQMRVTRGDLERWISRDWVRPDGEADQPLFTAIDVARVTLIRDLRDQMQVNDDAMPVVLRLLDQLYGERRRMRRMRDAIHRAAPEDVRQAVLRLLAEPD